MADTESIDRKFQKDLNAGISALVLLRILDRTDKPMYGYQIASLISDGSREEPAIKQGTLYPVLHSLEDGGLLASEVEPSVTGPPRRYYSITQAGREALVRWQAIWNKTRNFVDTTLQGVDDDKHN